MTVLLVSSCLAPASAQSPQASISGTVKDAQGAVIPGVSVEAVNDGAGVRTAVRTDESGFYSLPALPAGSYTIRVEHEGFQSQAQAGIVLTTGQTLELNFALKTGAVTETVAVTAAAPLTKTRSSDSSQLIEAGTSRTSRRAAAARST